ncbi:DNA polymerase-3 subunit beta [Kibdelosporangium banguiense]|uniref:DNA polymerase-3 subunit beta n=1 Tax=Kibdelosporangium banguiense TaxID=1365924 RepID=A0ABS4U1U0_9PSEU|nr:DNA polymerase III subunit beta [Kibdelosporangium banguiense]MBP2330632.1 DNA polymerase-3 subunit beta [Kibdelosporangium banguiense]
MHITVSRDEFADASGWIARNLETRPTHPVAGAICLDATHTGEQDVLRASGFTPDTSTRADIPATLNQSGRAMVSGTLLAAVAKMLPDKPVELTTDGSMLHIRCGSSQSSLPLMDADIFPALPDMPELIGELPTHELVTGLSHVAGAAGTDDALPVFTGICVEITDGPLRLIASDRYRLAMRELPWQPAITTATGGDAVRLLVPGRALQELVKGMTGSDTIRIGATADGTVFGLNTGIRQATTRLIDGQFPDCRKLIPDTANGTVDVAVTPLIEAVKRVSVLADRERDAVQFEFTDTGHLDIRTGDTAHGGGRESVPIKLTGTPLAITLMAHRALGALTAISTPIAHIELTEPHKAMVVRERHDTPTAPTTGQAAAHRHVQLVMPLRPPDQPGTNAA